MAAEGTHRAVIMVSEAERIRAPLEYPEHEDLNPEDPLISEGTTTDYISTIRSKAKLLLHGMKSLCYGDPAAFNSEAFGNQEDHHGLPLACGDNIQTDCVGS